LRYYLAYSSYASITYLGFTKLPPFDDSSISSFTAIKLVSDPSLAYGDSSLSTSMTLSDVM
jgi:hypothetical protein